MRIFVIGNIAIDETYRVETLPGEGESILGTKLSSELGGKGANQAVVLARAGLRVTLVAGVGSDDRADRIRARLAAEPLEARLVAFDQPSTDLSIVLSEAGGGNAIVTTVDCARALTFADIEPHLRGAARGDLMILQGNLSLPATEALFGFARSRGMRVAFNPSPVAEGFAALLKHADMLFLNQHEARVLTGQEGEAAIAALQALGVGTVVLTLGRDGALLGSGARRIPAAAQAVEVVDTTGAGDTFQSAAIAAALLGSGEIDALALRVASRAAALTVSRQGTVSAFPTPREFSQLRETAASG
ncbi:ribokinase [Limimaricola sp.]|uniref:ribokinase n=1 Tax=Limimaricola sp. TaxID=2211665 RepID=UPI0040588830